MGINMYTLSIEKKKTRKALNINEQDKTYALQLTTQIGPKFQELRYYILYLRISMVSKDGNNDLE